MKRQLGISIYPDHSDAAVDRRYLKKASDEGFTRVFMSMLEVTDGKEAVKERFTEIIAYCKELHYEVILDVDPNIFADLGISYDDLRFFHELGADGIRLDAGFDGNKEAMISFNPYQLIIELNMSNDVAYLDNILSYQANRPFIYGCHNFYPQEGTALPYSFFEACSQRFKQQGIRTAAFISSQAGTVGPWSINDGLPTLEEHRHLDVAAAAKHLFATNLIDDVIIGNAYASDEELAVLGRINRYQTEFTLELLPTINEVEKDIALREQHFRRGDITEQVIRSTEVRKKYKAVANPPHDNIETFQLGDVVVGNDQFGKYKNELQIVLTPHQDLRKNKIGHINLSEHRLLDYVHPWTKFQFSDK